MFLFVFWLSYQYNWSHVLRTAVKDKNQKLENYYSEHYLASSS
jgi:hypothetical protein